MPSNRLAVVAKSFDRPSETFIRRHAHDLAPGHTVLIATEQKSSENFSTFPALWTQISKKKKGLRLFLSKSKVNRRIHRFLTREDIDTVLVEYGTVGAEYITPLAKRDRRVFVHFHGYDATKDINSSQGKKYRHMFERADGFIAPSQFIAECLVELGCPRDKIIVCACGVDPGEFLPSRRQSKRLLAVGRFVEKKSPLSTIKAVELALRHVPDLHLDFVGNGDLLESCKSYVDANGLDKHVTFHGSQPHDFVQSLMQNAQVFLQHSVRAPNGDCEGLPVSVLEAMASAVPVVSTRHSGIPEAVIEGETGFLVDEHDVPGMAAALVALYQKPEAEIAQMAEAARARIVAEFSTDVAASRLREHLGLTNIT